MPLHRNRASITQENDETTGLPVDFIRMVKPIPTPRTRPHQSNGFDTLLRSVDPEIQSETTTRPINLVLANAGIICPGAARRIRVRRDTARNDDLVDDTPDKVGTGLVAHAGHIASIETQRPGLECL